MAANGRNGAAASPPAESAAAHPKVLQSVSASHFPVQASIAAVEPSRRNDTETRARALVNQASFVRGVPASLSNTNESNPATLAPIARSSSAASGVSSLSQPTATSTAAPSPPNATPITSRPPTAPVSSSRRAEPRLPSARVASAPPTAMYWSRTPSGGRPPKGLRAHTATVVGSDMWVVGGCDIRGTCFKDVWKFDTVSYTWSKPKVVGEAPPVTRAHSTTLVDEKLYVFGGGDGPTYYNDLYCFDTLCHSWSKPIVTGTPPSRRRAHAAVYYDSRIIIFGGGNGAHALNDVHALDLSDARQPEWIELSVRGRPPIARGYHTMNLVGNKAIVFGGSDGAECFGDVFILDLDQLTWTEVKAEVDPAFPGPFPRLSHTCTTLGSYLAVIGGHDGVNFSNEILFFNLVTLEWEARTASGIPPSPRGYHTAVLHDSRLLLFGGFNGQMVFDELWTLELAGLAFLPQITRFEVGVPWDDDDSQEDGRFSGEDRG